jgi:hypothetical protein
MDPVPQKEAARAKGKAVPPDRLSLEQFKAG